ncbi:protein preli-like [Thrips palmi]|uniref:Protein preli-like n=1 Tax=Thrips palmi TaxID=161013 RepID=A0A6P8YZ03_THRPL|nr:protein preli-like [Thrips palmi]
MVKFYESSTVFQYNWHQVAQAFWQRYPNPHSSHVLSEDTVFREVRDNKLFTKRLLTKTNRVPKWGERFINNPKVGIIEESVVDPKTRTLTTYTRNVGYTKVMSVVEKVVYRESDDNPNCTIAVRSGWVDSQVFGFKHAIQAFGVERFRKNCQQMILGFNHVLSHLYPKHGQHETNVSSEKSSVQEAKDKLKSAAKRASDLVMPKANVMVASCQD